MAENDFSDDSGGEEDDEEEDEMGKGMNEVGKRMDTGQIVIRIDKKYFRPSEVNSLLGDPTKAIRKLGWKPSTSLEELVSEMIEHDKEIFLRESFLKENGFEINSNYQYD